MVALRPVRIGIVGNGILGCSVAYHLCRAAKQSARGEPRCVGATAPMTSPPALPPPLHISILDPHGVAAGSTSRSAGLLLHLSANPTKIKFSISTVRDVRELEHTLGESLGLQRVGSLRVSPDLEHFHALQAQASLFSDVLARKSNHGDDASDHEHGAAPLRWISRREAEKLVPWLSLSAADDDMRLMGGVGGVPQSWLLHVGDDAVMDPSVLASGYLRGARSLEQSSGAQLELEVLRRQVVGLLVCGRTNASSAGAASTDRGCVAAEPASLGRHVHGVRCDDGSTHEFDFIIDATGPFAGQLAAEAGLLQRFEPAPPIVTACTSAHTTSAADAGNSGSQLYSQPRLQSKGVGGLPMAAVRSHYWIASASPEFASLVTPDQPMVILPGARAYTRPVAHGSLVLGLQEEQSRTWSHAALRQWRRGADAVADAHNQVAAGEAQAEDLVLEALAAEAAFEDSAESASANGYMSKPHSLASVFPALPRGDVALQHYVAGLTSYTPDGNFIVGGLPRLPCGGTVSGTSVVSGCNGAGFSAAGGLGALAARHALAECGVCDWDATEDDAQAQQWLRELSVERFDPVDVTTAAFRDACSASRAHKFGHRKQRRGV